MHHPALKEWVREYKVRHPPSGEVTERELHKLLSALRAHLDESTAVSTTAWDAGVVYNPDKRPSTLADELQKAARLLRRHQRVRNDAMIETFVDKLPKDFPAMRKAVDKYYEDHGSSRIQLHRRGRQGVERAAPPDRHQRRLQPSAQDQHPNAGSARFHASHGATRPACRSGRRRDRDTCGPRWPA